MRTNSLSDFWSLDPAVSFLNHGSYGACPRVVLGSQDVWRQRMEAEPVAFLGRDLPTLLQDALGRLANFLGAEPADLAFVPNATSGVNTVLRSLRFEQGDELLTTNHAYNACRNALEFVAERCGARVVCAQVPFPISDPEEVVEAIVAAATRTTRLVLLDHVTSPTGLIFPVQRIVAALHERGIETLIDGAHAPGMLALDIPAIGAGYYTGNGHKWLLGPKGSAFLWVRRDLQAEVRPLTISDGANTPRLGQSRFQAEFAWQGTHDPSSYLTLPDAIDFGSALLPGGWAELMRSNHEKAMAGGRVLHEALGIAMSAPESMLGSMVAVPLPDATGEDDNLNARLFERYAIEVPVMPFPGWPRRVLRISAQAYNEPAEYVRLAEALVAEGL
ncbi:MAG: aminotransferase class V-fold PLP-dependent enzyme [Tepidiformaceae bacterium]